MKPKALREIEEQLEETSRISEEYLNSKIKKLIARWSIVILTFMLGFHYFPFFKWSLILLVPLGFIAVWRIFYTKYNLNKQMDDIRQTIEDIDQR